MAYFIFQKNFDNLEGSLYRIAENQSDLNNFNIIQSDYKIIEDSQINFNFVKFGTKSISKYNDNEITYIDTNVIFKNKNHLQLYVNNLKNTIKLFLDNNTNHSSFNVWNTYYNQLNSLNLDSITYPLNKSLEQYFNDLGQPSYSILQLP
jgi:hypothetical protein